MTKKMWEHLKKYRGHNKVSYHNIYKKGLLLTR